MIDDSAWIMIGIGQVAFIFFVAAFILYLKNKNLSATILKLHGSSNRLPLSTDSNEDSEGSLTDADIAEVSSENTDQEELLIMKRKIETYEKTIENLEKFRSLFFETRKKFEQIQLSHAKLIDDIKNLRSEEDSEKLLKSLESISLEKEQLEAHLSQMESEFEILMNEAEIINIKKQDFDSNNTGQDKDSHSNNIDGIIHKQHEEIKRLKNFVQELTIDSHSKGTLEKSIGNLSSKNKEMETAITILENENTHLLDQIEAFVKLRQSDTISNANDNTTEKLNKLENELLELKEKYADMESEYLRVCDESSKG